MHLDVQWQTDPTATILHALRLLADERPLVDHAIVSLCSPGASKLRNLGLSDRFWGELTVASADVDFSQAVEDAARRAQFSGPTAEIAGLLHATQQAVASSDLDIGEELRLRQRPLREIWEASGPGMLLQISRATMRPIVSRIELQGLLPLRGGFGRAFVQAQRVQIELVLANPAAEVPEVIRLAWLIAQLSIPSNVDIAADRLALVPCCLAAAEQLGMARCEPSSLAKCLRQWQVNVAEEEVGVKLHQWWNQRDENAPWSESIAQVSELLRLDG